jgi:hypothetical protein
VEQNNCNSSRALLLFRNVAAAAKQISLSLSLSLSVLFVFQFIRKELDGRPRKMRLKFWDFLTGCTNLCSVNIRTRILITLLKYKKKKKNKVLHKLVSSA